MRTYAHSESVVRGPFTNTTLVAGGGIAFVLGSALASGLTGDWDWFGRSGSVLTLAGVVLTARPLIRLGLARWIEEQSVIDGGTVPPTRGELEAGRQRRLDSRAFQTGTVLAVAGTLIWGYGDLVGYTLVLPVWPEWTSMELTR